MKIRISRIRANVVVANTLCILLLLGFSCRVLSSLLWLVWMNLFLFAWNRRSQRIVLLAFSVTFFVFLLGREFLEQFFRYGRENFSDGVYRHTSILLIVSLVTILVSYAVFEMLFLHMPDRPIRKNTALDLSLRQISGHVFVFFLFFSCLYMGIAIWYIVRNGYFVYYTHFKTMVSRNYMLLAMSKCEIFMLTALCAYLATMPPKREGQKRCICYFLYLLVTVMTGARSTFVLGILFLVIYFMYRHANDPHEQWLTRRKLYAGCAGMPVMLSVLSVIQWIRQGASGSGKKFLDAFLSFFYDQGVSINVIKRAYEFGAYLRADRLYSMFFAHTGIFSLIFSRAAGGGNSVAQSQGSNMAHALSYVLMKDQYLSGRGLGTCYIAELYQDFGLTGVILGNIFVALVLCVIRDFHKGALWTAVLKLLIIQKILWMPRGNFGEFISLLASPFTIAALAALAVVSYIHLSNGRGAGRRGSARNRRGSAS